MFAVQVAPVYPREDRVPAQLQLPLESVGAPCAHAADTSEGSTCVGFHGERGKRGDKYKNKAKHTQTRRIRHKYGRGWVLAAVADTPPPTATPTHTHTSPHGGGNLNRTHTPHKLTAIATNRHAASTHSFCIMDKLMIRVRLVRMSLAWSPVSKQGPVQKGKGPFFSKIPETNPSLGFHLRVRMSLGARSSSASSHHKHLRSPQTQKQLPLLPRTCFTPHDTRGSKTAEYSLTYNRVFRP
jgi:hypothetical protein